jgi:hypothetical protein
MSNVTPYSQRLPSFTGDWEMDQAVLKAFMARFMSDSVNTLQGNTRVVNNMGGEYKTLTIQTPTSDWTAPTLAGAWAVFIAGTTDVGYRKDALGNVWVRGAVASGALNSTIFTLPTGYRPAQDWNVEQTMGSSGSCQLRVDFTNGNVNQVNAGQLVTGAPGAPAYGTLDNHFVSVCMSFPCADESPGVLSCFPLKYQTGLKTVSAVKVAHATNATANNTGFSVGNPAWSFDGSYITISTIPGLALGQTYSVTLEALP